MPPYTPYKSKAQEAKLNAMAGRGEIDPDEVQGKNRASKDLNLPSRVGGSVKLKPHHFSKGGK